MVAGNPTFGPGCLREGRDYDPTVATITAIVPATNDPATLEECLDAIRSSAEPPDELIVVTEAPGPGPAAARNEGVRRASGDIVAFVDADVLVHRDAFTRIRKAFGADPGLVALFGSYDDRPIEDGVVSGFRNLLHHFIHQSSPGEASTFWAGLGAIRRDVFLAAGGFDAARFRHPSVEDIELGMRLTADGRRIVLDPAVQGTHLKRWRLGQMLHTDLVRRGLPWAQLLLERGLPSRTLNLGWRHRLSAVVSLAALGGTVTRKPKLALGSLGALAWLNRGFYALLWRRQGPGRAVLGVGLHALHHLTGVAAALLAFARHLRNGRAGSA
jgi:glycosyltransferase involved in cell wall biosynthesis